MPSILITGANRGLGLEFCRQYGEQGWRVFACCRNPEITTDAPVFLHGRRHWRASEEDSRLQEMAAKWSHLTIHQLDVSDFGQIDQLAEQLKSEPLDILLSNAGVYGDKADYEFGSFDYQLWQETLRINTLAPVKLAEAFLPNLLKSSHPLLVAITSLMGSMGDNSSGGSIFYRSSKAALNAAMKSLAIDLKPQNIAVLILHPGWVRTDMGGPRAPTSVEESISGMRQVIEEFSLAKSGSFLNFKGQELPW
jgi:NAD(P)-dependent dehydrogenase (short-subunit alcohol dehydrogenase family)